MKTLLVLATAALLACCSAPKPTPAAAPTPAGPDAGSIEADLKGIESELVEAGEFGSRVGHLFEKKGDLLSGAGRVDEAIAAYERAARAYGQSPEATTMPIVNSDRAREKAEKLKMGRVKR
jgi:hypothetical protein